MVKKVLGMTSKEAAMDCRSLNICEREIHHSFSMSTLQMPVRISFLPQIKMLAAFFFF